MSHSSALTRSRIEGVRSGSTLAILSSIVVEAFKLGESRDRFPLGHEPVLDRIRIGVAERHAAHDLLVRRQGENARAICRGNSIHAACGQVSSPRARAATITFSRNIP